MPSSPPHQGWTLGLRLVVALVLLCGPGGGRATTRLYGAGGSLPSRLYTDAFLAYRFVETDVQLTYSPTSSPDGLCGLRDNVSNCTRQARTVPIPFDFAGTDMPPPAAGYPSDLALYPTVANAVVPVYNLNGVCDGLVLTPQTLAQIFRGAVTRWDDPLLTAYNPNCSLPANVSIEVVVRSDPSGATDTFTKALCSFDGGLDPANGNVWDQTNASVTRRVGNQGVIAHVILTPFTLGYTSLAYAQRNRLPKARLWRYGRALEASTLGVGFAVLEQGVFDPHSVDTALVADLQGAQSTLAWPIAGYSYLAMRKAWHRPGASCEDVEALVKFWRWFWTSSVVATLADGLGFTPLPSVVQEVVLARFTGDITCDGELVYQDDGESQLRITGVGPNSMSNFFKNLPAVYGTVNPNVRLHYAGVPTTTDLDVATLLSSNTYVISRSSVRPLVPDSATLTLSAVGFAVISSYRVTVDGPTLARILEGKITQWQHPDLQALNPQGILDERNRSLGNASTPIVLVPSASFFSQSWRRLMQRYWPGYTGAAAEAAGSSPSSAATQSVVAGINGSLSVIPLVGDLAQGVLAARFRRDDGSVVAPSWQSVQACASSDVLQAASGRVLSLQDSQSPLCYPLTEAIYLTLKKPDCDSAEDVTRAETASFADWLFSSEELDVALQAQNLASLQAVSPISVEANRAALASAVCVVVGTTDSAMSHVLPIVLSLIGLQLLLLGVGAGALWGLLRRLRAAQRRRSTDAAALRGAEALLRLDLSAVEWLDRLDCPDPPLLVLRSVAHLLRGVKPYIPDPVFQALRDLEDNASQSLAEDPPSPLLDPTEATGGELLEVGAHDCLDPEPFSSILTDPCSVGPAGDPSPHHRRAPWAALLTPAALLQDPVRRQCTCAAVRFDLVGPGRPRPEEAVRHASAVATYVIAVGKGAGATVDEVTGNTVVLYWGLDGSGAHTLQATRAAVELAKAARVLPPPVQPALRLQIGIGQGLCVAATLCLGGLRQAVVRGPEAARAAAVVAHDQPHRCGCAVLVTEEVHQRLQQCVECHPRVLFDNTLLWEPVYVPDPEASAGEWMYELQPRPAAQPRRLSARALERPFRLAGQGAPREAVQREVANLKAHFASELSPEDIRALDSLLV